VSKVIVKRKFPYTDRLGGKEVTFKLLSREDAETLARFTETLSRDDLMFLRLDVRDPETREQWLRNVETGNTVTVLAMDTDGEIIGYGSLHVNTRTWTSHIGEFRILVIPAYRGTGLSTRLINEIFQISRELKLERLVVHVAREQRRFRGLLEEMGFQAEALLTDWVKSVDGVTHDLVIMSQHLVENG
jgi:L-amino acid N-acyltransferase YncA